MKSELLSSYLEVKQKTDRDVRQLGVLASDRYEADSTASQSIINLPFTITQTTEQKRGFQLFIDGQLLREGTANDYQWTTITNAVSSQVTLNIAIPAGKNIIALKVGGYQDLFPNPSSVTATLNADVNQPHKMALAAFQPFVAKTFITAPNTTIVNRAQVEAGSLKAIAGVERIPCRSIALSRTEFGPAGQPVFELDSKDSRVRFIGSGWFSSNGVAGGYITTLTVGDILEITYYGTGLNILTQPTASNRSSSITIDGVSSGTWTESTTAMSGILTSRNYAPNMVSTVVSGQTLGWHTIQLTMAVLACDVYGFEILNQRTDLAVLAGVAYGGAKQETLASLSTSAFNAGVTGTRGARVVKYLQNNVISQAVTNVDTTTKTLTNTDHTNEEVVRRINFREFGANRADDFSTLSTTNSNRAFTLDDGTTTLVGNNVVGNSVANDDMFYPFADGNFWTLTFVGTGLDIIIKDSNAGGGTEVHTIYVDGVSVGNLHNIGISALRTLKICSGLPYGTHTIKMLRVTASIFTVATKDFIIYQPKKPSIPSGAIEVADYNVMADYVASSSAVNGFIGSGVLRKNPLRENTYVGTWTAISINVPIFESGWDVNTITTASYIEYSFFGTGVVYTGLANTTTAQNATVIVDGLALNSGTNAVASINFIQTSTGLTFSASGSLAGISAAQNKYRISISGLALGKHTIRVTTNTSAINMYCDGLDIITPIHSYNTKVGSLSLKDTRAFSPIVDKPDAIDLSKCKAWVVFDQVNNNILSSYNISQVLQHSVGATIIFFTKPFKTANYTMSGSGGNGVAQIAVFTYGPIHGSVGGQHANRSTIGTADLANTYTNSIVSVMYFGELEDEGEI